MQKRVWISSHLFGDNDSVRFALIRGTANGHIAQSLLSFYMKREVLQSAMVWFARVPTEANISDFPSRRQEHPLLSAELNRNDLAQPILQAILNELKAVGRQCHLGGSMIGDPPSWKRVRMHAAAITEQDDEAHL